MSSKHRHGLPRKRPSSTKRAAIDDEMPTLEPTAGDDGPLEDGPIKIACEGGDGLGAAVTLTVTVPEMEKKAVQGAVEGPLQRAVERFGARLRFRDVTVDFAGEALIGSAMKSVVKDIVGAAKPQNLTIKRGFGAERLLEGPAPELAVASRDEDGETVVTIDGSGFEADDLPLLLPPVLQELCGKADGAKFLLEFEGGVKPDSDLRSHIGDELQAAGARRVAIGARVLFDRELLDRCKVVDGDEVVQVTIDPAADPAITGEAMETVMPEHALGVAGKAVRVTWTSAPAAGVADHFVRLVSQFAPEHIEFVTDGNTKVVWPGVLAVAAGKREVQLRVQPHGRDHSEVLELFPQECRAFEAELYGKVVVVDWPQLFVVDEDTERCLAGAFDGLGVERVFCTIGGEEREPFWPPAVTLDVADGRSVVTVDTDAAKPAELVRAVERAVPRFADRIAGQPARIVIAGDGMPSRTLQRAVLDQVAEAGPSRLEMEDHGPVDVLLPPLLAFHRSGDHDVRIEVALADRDAEQRAMAIGRELDQGSMPGSARVTLATDGLPDDVTQQLLAALIEHGVESVDGADGAALYPEPLPEPEPEELPEPEALPEPEPESEPPTLSAPEAAPEAAPAAAPPPIVAAGTNGATPGLRVLGRNDQGVPPTVLLGVDAGTDPAHLAAIEDQLTGNVARFAGRAVMVVLQQNGQDVPVRKSDALVQLLQRVLPTGAAATLVFRGPDAQGRPHFQVLHSTVRALPAGMNCRDPR